MMLDAHVLVLNRLYQPVNVTNVRRAICLMYIGAARALDRQYRLFDFPTWAALSAEYGDETVGAVHGRVLIPRIVVLQAYERIPIGRIRFSRHNIFVRDNHTCQYCDKLMARRHLNLDHVIPRSQGGKTNWENVVTSCIPCNFHRAAPPPNRQAWASRGRRISRVGLSWCICRGCAPATMNGCRFSIPSMPVTGTPNWSTISHGFVDPNRPFRASSAP